MPCKKVKYITKKIAENYSKQINKKSGGEIVLQKAYFCKQCEVWHLTSKGDRKDREIKRLLELIKELQSENQSLKSKNNNPKIAREITLAVRVDERVKQLKTQVERLQDGMSESARHLRIRQLTKDRNDLICKIMKLEKIISEHNLIYTIT